RSVLFGNGIATIWKVEGTATAFLHLTFIILSLIYGICLDEPMVISPDHTFVKISITILEIYAPTASYPLALGVPSFIIPLRMSYLSDRHLKAITISRKIHIRSYYVRLITVYRTFVELNVALQICPTSGCQRLNTKDVPRARRWLLVLASGPLSAFLWCVYGVSPARSHLRMSHCSLVFQSRCAATILGINPRNSSEMWLVDRIKPNYKKTQRSSIYNLQFINFFFVEKSYEVSHSGNYTFYTVTISVPCTTNLLAQHIQFSTNPSPTSVLLLYNFIIRSGRSASPNNSYRSAASSSFHKLNNCSLTSFSSKMVLLPTGPMKFVRLWTTFSLASKTFVIFRCGDLDIKTWSIRAMPGTSAPLDLPIFQNVHTIVIACILQIYIVWLNVAS
ncbi:hypothetical protein L9F63_000136, partial [Diploptera punctata]